LAEFHGPLILGRFWEDRNLLPKSSHVPMWYRTTEGLSQIWPVCKGFVADCFPMSPVAT
jgi:hypothetical protein